MSRGRVENGAIRSGYHGLAFAGDGACIDNPHGPITPKLKVRAYPVRSAYRGIWVWLGDPDKADDELIPGHSCLIDEAAPAKGGHLLGQANYQLYVDNLLDLSHVDHLHTALSGGDAMADTEQHVSDEGRTVTVSWVKRAHKPMPLEGAFDLIDEGVFKRRTTIVWSAPGAMLLDVTIEPPGASPRKVRGSVHVMTPETAKSTHYFWMFTRGSDDHGDDETHARFALEGERVFRTEDSPMIAAVQESMGSSDLFDLHPVSLRTDQGALKVRRKLADMMRAEQHLMSP